MKENGNKICIYCKGVIHSNQRAVKLITYEGDKEIEDVRFHLNCYSEWHNKRALEKAQNRMAGAYKLLKDKGIIDRFQEIVQDGNKTY